MSETLLFPAYTEEVAGVIHEFAGSAPPAGYLLCDGQAVLREQYPKLFEAIGTTYGEGDGTTTFNVPNLQKKVPVGLSSDLALGQTGGSEQVALLEENLPTLEGAVTIHQSASGSNLYSGTGVFANSTKITGKYKGGGSTTNDAFSIQTLRFNAGSDQPHDNMPPYVVVNFIISTGTQTSVVQENPNGVSYPLSTSFGGTGTTSVYDYVNNVLKPELLDLMMPVGTLYMSLDDSKEPAELFGGTWERLTGKFPWFGTDPGATGGSLTKTITTSNLPRVTGQLNIRGYDDAFMGTQASSLGVFSRTAYGSSCWVLARTSSLGQGYGSFSMSFGSGSALDVTPPFVNVAAWQRIE